MHYQKCFTNLFDVVLTVLKQYFRFSGHGTNVSNISNFYRTAIDSWFRYAALISIHVVAIVRSEKGLHGEFEDLSLTTDVAGPIYDLDYDGIDRALGILPKFQSPEQNNVTVIAGMTATLPCSIASLEKYKIAWLDAKSIPLTLEDRRVIDDSRFSVVRPSVNDWNLQIRDTKWEDHGRYLCSVNTLPAVQSILIMLTVKVPAQIIDELSTNDVTVREGNSFSLVCNVTGVPRPVVTWYRRPSPTVFGVVNIHDADGRGSTWREPVERVPERGRRICELAAYNSGEEATTGEILYIRNVSRHCGNVYECNATNEVPPSVTRAMRVIVEFAPEIKMTNTKIGQSRGRETILECHITAFPHAVNYWEKDGKRISSSTKHRIEAYDDDDDNHSLTLRLSIPSIDSTDYGEYRCFASNAVGSHVGSVNLTDSEPITSRSLTHSGDPLVVVIPLQHSKDPDVVHTKIGRQTLVPGHHRPDQQRHATEHRGRGKDISVTAVNKSRLKTAPPAGGEPS